MAPRNLEAARAMQQARVDLILTAPFFGALALRLDLVECADIPTWATDGKRLLYHPGYTLSMSHAERKATFCHEVMHCAMGHVWRKDAREHRKWNVACDYAIDPEVQAAGMAQKDQLINRAWKGMSAEQIYALLPEDAGDHQGPGDVLDPADADRTPELAQNWQIWVEQAARAAKAQGNLPASIALLVDEMRRPIVDWRALLHRFLQALNTPDYSWRQPSRRYMAQGLYLPSLQGQPALPPIVLAIDTSDSTMDAQPQFFGEVPALIDQARPERLDVLWIDAAVSHLQSFEPGDPVELEPHGGGGTDFRPAFDWVREQSFEPACLIYLTDLYGTFPPEPPPYPVLWVSVTRDQQAPFGDTVYMEV